MLFDILNNILVDSDNTTYDIVKSICRLWMTILEVMSKLLNFGWIKKLVEMVIFPGKVGVDGCVLVYEVWRDTKRMNGAQINALAPVTEVVFTAVVVISHGEKILLLLLLLVGC